MPTLVLGWGIAETCLAACNNFPQLLAARFFLGLFEAGCMPLFAIITSQWYRRAEQPLRVSIWYSTNGLATMAASAISYGLGHIPSTVLYPWQMSVTLCAPHAFPANSYQNLPLLRIDYSCKCAIGLLEVGQRYNNSAFPH